MAHLTGTHIYTYLKCPRAVALDLHGDRALRRPRTEAEELLLRRGREHEERVVAGLGYARPEHPERDFEAGAAATLALLRAGWPGVHQGVLRAGERLGIPDLLRKEPGASALGAWHYVVGDVKSSRRPRSDQVMQVVFYSRLLAETQRREPEYAYLLLRDGSEQRFRLAEYREAGEEVEALAARLLEPDAARAERPFLGKHCASCTWSEHCAAELEAADDLSLLQRMTRGLRDMLEGSGIRSCAAACAMPIETVARRTHIEMALLRRIRRAAEAHAAGEPLPEPKRRHSPLPPAALVHVLRDPFEERVLFFGVRPLDAGPEAVRTAEPCAREDELPAFLELIAGVPAGQALAHFGKALPAWFAEAAQRRPEAQRIERRMLDLAPRLKGAATYPRPIFELADYVRCCLGREPRGAGVAVQQGATTMRELGTSELDNLAELVTRLLN